MLGVCMDPCFVVWQFENMLRLPVNRIHNDWVVICHFGLEANSRYVHF